MMNDASRYKGSTMELKDEVISYIETISEIRDIDQLFAKFSSYSQGDICQVLVDLCLRGEIVIEQDIIRFPSNNDAKISSSRQETSLGLLNLRAPLKNRLENEGIRTIEQLTALSEVELLSIRGMGLTKLKEINEALDHWGSL